MAASMLHNSKNICRHLSKVDKKCCLQLIRNAYKYRHRGLPPELSKTWQEKKAEIEMVPPEEDMAVNIGFPVKNDGAKMTRKMLRQIRSEQDETEMERKSRLRELMVPLDVVMKESFPGRGQESVYTVAKHYGIYHDLFGDAYFYPQLQLEVGYPINDEPDMLNRVYHGNQLPPSMANKTPEVYYEADPDKLYTLCMVAPDSHLQYNNKEYIHWMVGNIPGSAVDQGEAIYNYLPIFPVKGTGYHRYVFILYQQEKQLDFTEEKKAGRSTKSLTKRTFETLEYYRQRQDDITPVGLCFFQSEWDESVREVFHQTLQMTEPRFEFLPPAPVIPNQKLWPIREPFNVYMDRYRDVKDIGEEVLVEKLKNADPFKPRPPPKKYPNVYTIPKDTPSWLRMKIHEQKTRKSYWKDLDD